MRSRFHRAVVGLGGSLAVLLLAGCGSGRPAAGLPPPIAAALHRDLIDVRTAANARRPGRARLALDAFAAAVSAQQTAGTLTDSETSSLRAGIAQARERIAAEVHARGGSVVTVTPAPAPPPALGTVQPSPGNGSASANGNGSANGDARMNGKDHGKGHGHGKDNGGGGGGGGD